jgi:hypothetical protein
MGHKIDSTQAVRYSALFPAFEADAMAAMMEREPLGEDNVPDLILMNYKGADFVGHKYGPDSEELRVTLGEMDRQLKRMLSALEAKVGNDYLLAVTADHGMPSEPSSADRRHLAPSIVDLLHQKFDPEAKQLITSFEPENGQIFVDEDRLSHLGLTLRDLAHFLESQPFLFAVFTNDDVRSAANALKPATPTPRHSRYKLSRPDNVSQPSAGSSLVTSLHGFPREVCLRPLQLNTSVSYPECPDRGPTHTPMAAKSPIDVASGATGPCPRRCATTCRKGLRCGKSALPRELERPRELKGFPGAYCHRDLLIPFGRRATLTLQSWHYSHH